MSEDSSPETVEVISHRGILIAMAALIAIGAIAGFAFGGVRWGFGLIFGGALAFGNYLWLERSTRQIFTGSSASAPLLSLKYIARYFAIGAILLAVYLTDAFPVAAVIVGLASFAFAVVLQGLKNIISS